MLELHWILFYCGFHLLSHNKMDKSNNFFEFDSFCVVKTVVQSVFNTSSIQQLIS